MEEALNQKMRSVLLDCYGWDINEAKCFFSTQNYAFIFPDKPYMIRVGIGQKKSRSEVMSELIWVDDLKEFKNTVCEPNPSLHGRLLEEFEIDGTLYRASSFRTARGNVQRAVEMTPMFFICVGELLGMIHHVSTNERELGIHYRRAEFADTFAAAREEARAGVPEDVMARIEAIEAQVKALPQTLGEYGICHGDFHLNNFFVESNNIWLFDFDSCTYAGYMYDIAAFLQACFLYGYGAGKDCREVLHKDMLPYFRLGYELNHRCSEEFWSRLELFMTYRTAYTYLKLARIDKFGLDNNLDRMKRFFSFIVSRDNPLDAMTEALRSMG